MGVLKSKYSDRQDRTGERGVSLPCILVFGILKMNMSQKIWNTSSKNTSPWNLKPKCIV